MPRISMTLKALFTISCLSVVGYFYATRTQPAAQESFADRTSSASNAAMDAEQSSQRPAGTEPASVPGEVNSPPTMPQDILAKWATEGTDAKTRAAEIAALATAPKSQAVPVLQRVLNAGTDEDRQLALESLRTLALQQGDADGGIRNVLRQAIYHGDSEAITNSAQATLDAVEHDLSRPADK